MRKAETEAEKAEEVPEEKEEVECG